MSKIYFHEEVYEGVTRVQAGPFDQVLQRDAASCIARAVIALANGGSGGSGRVLFDCAAFWLEATQEALGGLQVFVAPDARGAVARMLGVGSRRVEVAQIPLERLAEVLERCWEHAPLFFGIPGDASDASHGEGDSPDLSSVTPSVEFLKAWRSLGAVFHHGAWVAFSAGHLAPEDLLATVMASFRDAGWECLVSPEPM